MDPYALSTSSLPDTICSIGFIRMTRKGGTKRQGANKRRKITLSLGFKDICKWDKAFRALDETLKSISDTRVQEGAFQRNVFQENAFQVPALIVHLDGEAA